MAPEWDQLVVDAADPVALGRWWAEALGRVVVNDAADEYEIRPAPDRLPGLLFVPVPELKTVGNRLHLDFRPDDPAAEVARLLAPGTRRSGRASSRGRGWCSRVPRTTSFCVLEERRPG
ncbi:VOC family protein [Streptomyces sp. NPDC051896]|uniref:VOC family protein n=1 Tax=Streptomyces sp. NPDC051896 TaxID=3155416 RepID=UPI0034498D98